LRQRKERNKKLEAEANARTPNAGVVGQGETAKAGQQYQRPTLDARSLNLPHGKDTRT
jgi:hypothetical protein